MPVYRDLMLAQGHMTRGLAEVMDAVPGMRAAEGMHAWFDLQSRATGIPHKSDYGQEKITLCRHAP